MRLLLPILITCLGFAQLCEAKTIRELFSSEPDNILLILPSRTRLDMLDYFDMGNKVAANNLLSSESTTSQLIDVTDNSISLQLTDATKIDMMLYETVQGKDSVVAVVKTTLLPAPDSQIAFYDTHWNLLKKKNIFTEPTINDFVMPNTAKSDLATINELVKFPIISYEIATGSDNATIITARLGLEQFLSAEDWAKVKPFLRTSLTYQRQRNNMKFKLVKQ
ncbi:MAG: DUF3256 family protein [Muribaculaceae bacterium]